MRKRIKKAVETVTGVRKRGRAEPTEAIAGRVLETADAKERVTGGETEKALRADLADARKAVAELQAALTQLNVDFKEKAENAADLVKTVDRMQAELADARATLAKRDKQITDLVEERDAIRGDLRAVTTEKEALAKRLAEAEEGLDELEKQLHDATTKAEAISKRVATLEQLPAVPGSAFVEQAKQTPHVSTHMGSPVIVEVDDPRHTEEGCARRNGRCAWRALLGEVA